MKNDLKNSLVKLGFLCVILTASSLSWGQTFCKYKFDNSYQDASGNSHHATNNGAALTTDRNSNQNYAINFDGSSYVALGKLNGVGAILDTFNIRFFFKGNTSNVSSSSLFKTIDVGNSMLLGLNLNNNSTIASYGVFNFQMRDLDSRQLTFSFVNQACYNGDWHCVVIKILSAKNNKVKAYVDGIEQTIQMHSTDGPYNFANAFQYDLTLGTANNRGTKEGYFVGQVDEFMIERSGVNSGVSGGNSCPATASAIGFDEVGIELYPVPVQDELQIQSEQLQLDKIEIMDVKGKTLIVSDMVGSSVHTVSLTGLTPGVYLVKVWTIGGSFYHSKFVKN